MKLPLSTNQKLKLIIFDLDGTLVDSAPDIAEAANAMRAEMGYERKSTEQVKQWVGNGSAMLVRRAIADAQSISENSVSDNDFDQGHRLFFAHYKQCNGVHTQFYPNAKKTLLQLKKQNFQIAICTNKPAEFTHQLLKHLQVEHLFSCIVSGDTLSVKKPDPAPLLLCADQCRVSTDQCLMVGDSMTDIKAAKNAGVHVICLSHGYHRGADLKAHSTVIDNLAQLITS